MKIPTPWHSEVRAHSLVIDLPQTYRTIGWASLNGGSKRAQVLINHQIALGHRAATEAPRRYLAALARSMGFDPRRTVAMMTGVPIRRAAATSVSHGGLIVSAWCTAGCSNALRVGDRATFETPRPGTINIIVAINEPLSSSAMVEAIQIATEARVAALGVAEVRSIYSHETATGTGTDCILVAAPAAVPLHGYCGKHTRLGELIGRATLRVCSQAIMRWQRFQRR